MRKLLSYFLIFLIVSLPLCFATEISYSYDANGNLIQDESSYYEYNGFDQLIRVRLGNSSGTILSDYFYDHGGNRILTIDYNGSANTSTFYPSDSFVQVVNQSGSYNTTYYYAGNILLAADNGSIAYYHPDHLGSTTLVTNAVGALLRETKYSPFGAVLSGGNDRYLYTGQEFDAETDLYYYGARFYKPDYYHFTQPDRVISNIYDPQNLNRYSYVRNNPYKYTDPDGNVLWDAVDVGLFIWAWKDYKQDKSLFNTVNLIIAAVGVLPLIPNVPAYVSRGIELLSKSLNSGKIADLSRKAERALKGLYRAARSERLTANEIGRIGEESLEATYGGGKHVFSTRLGTRVVDVLDTSTGIAHESKVGYKTLTRSIKEQIKKDAALTRSGKIEGAEWHFFRSPRTGKIGASKELQRYLERYGIKYTVEK